MILILHCDTCNKELGRSDINDAHSFMSLMAIIHAGGEHGGVHKLRPQLLIDMLNPEPFKSLVFLSLGKHQITINCKHPSCKGTATYKDIPMVLCSGMIIAYHSGHEGHPLQVIIDGRDYTAI